MWIRRFAGLGVLAFLASFHLQAQLVEDPDWKESEAPPPPAFNAKQVVYIEMPPGMSLRYGVDPDTVRLTTDGIVRYVMVATGQDGAMNAQYEAIRCATAEYKVYARGTTADKWNPVRGSQWIALERAPRTLHAFLLAKQSLCSNRATAGHSSEDLARKLRNPPQQRLN